MGLDKIFCVIYRIHHFSQTREPFTIEYQSQCPNILMLKQISEYLTHASPCRPSLAGCLYRASTCFKCACIMTLEWTERGKNTKFIWLVRERYQFLPRESPEHPSALPAVHHLGPASSSPPAGKHTFTPFAPCIVGLLCYEKRKASTDLYPNQTALHV